MAVTNDLVTDRRVQRHVATLRETGYDVRTICRTDLAVKHSRGWRFYAGFNIKLRNKLLEIKPDVVWANDTDTLLGSWMAVKRLHCKLMMDAHELFPEVPEIQHKPLVRWVWRTLERWLMPKCDALLTVCQSIANYYKEKYDVDLAVVRNINEKLNTTQSNSSFHIPHSSLHTLLYQGHVNLGRGVDWAIDAMEWLDDCQLVVAGDGDLLDEMKAYAAGKPWADRIVFTGRLTPNEMEPLTAQADVGLVMLEDMGLSYHFALPNRIGDFVAAGVPMVVSDLPEMAAVVRRFDIGAVMEAPGAKALAEAVKKVLARQWTDADFAAAREDMNWNKEKQKLINLCYTTFC